MTKQVFLTCDRFRGERRGVGEKGAGGRSQGRRGGQTSARGEEEGQGGAGRAQGQDRGAVRRRSQGTSTFFNFTSFVSCVDSLPLFSVVLVGVSGLPCYSFLFFVLSGIL